MSPNQDSPSPEEKPVRSARPANLHSDLLQAQMSAGRMPSKHAPPRASAGSVANFRPGAISMSQFHVGRQVQSARQQVAEQKRKPEESMAGEVPVDADGIPHDPLSGLSENQRFVQFMTGNITLADLQGIDNEGLYQIAEKAQNFYSMGQYQKAQELFEALTVLDPTDSWFHLCLGLSFQQVGNDYRALLEMDRALFLNNTLIQGWVERGEFLMKHGHIEEALKDLMEAVRLGGEVAEDEPYSLRARILIDTIKGIADEAPDSSNASESPAGSSDSSTEESASE